MRIKIRGGTASNGEPSLCLTCRFATIVKGASLRDEIVECSQLSYSQNRVTFPVTRCTEYSDRRAAFASRDGGDRLGAQVRSKKEHDRVCEAHRVDAP